MKKEIREKVIEFKEREENLLISLNENPTEQRYRAELMKLKNERKKWLNEIAGFSSDLTPEEITQIDMLVSSAEREISRAAKYYAGLSEYITQSARKFREPQPGYEKVVDDKGQMVAIAEHCAMDKVRQLDKLNRKRNKKSFLNIVICKFKKSKQQEQAQESDGPSQR